MGALNYISLERERYFYRLKVGALNYITMAYMHNNHEFYSVCRRYMAEIMPIRRKNAPINESINQSIT